MQSMIKKYSHIPVSEGKEIEVEFMDDVNEGDKVVIKREFENIIKNPVGLTGIPKAPAKYCSVAISRDGNYVAVISYDGSPYINVYKKSTTGWDKLTVNDVPAGAYYGVGLSDDGTYLVASLNTSPYIVFFENTDDVYNILSDPAAENLPNYYSTYIAITPDNYVLYHEYSSPYNLHIYNIATRDLISKDVPYAQSSYYYDIYYGERTLIAIAIRYRIYLYEYTGSGSLVALANVNTGSYAYSCAFSTDGRYISTGLKTYEIVDNSLVEVPMIYGASMNSMCGISPTSWICGGENQLFYLEILNNKAVYTNTISIGSGSNSYGTKRAGNTFISGWSGGPYGIVFEKDTAGVNKAYKYDNISNVNGYGIALHSARRGQVGRALVLWDDGCL